MIGAMNSTNQTDTSSDIDKAARAAKTAAARAVLKEKLGGKSSLERGKERESKALDWIYRWGWASSTTLETLVGSASKKSGLAQRLIKNQLITSTKTISRRSEKYLPTSFLTLSLEGKRVVERTRESFLEYDLRPERINQNLLAHDEMAQRATADRLLTGEITGFLTEKEMRQKSENGIKNPDVVWIFPNMKVSVEIELSPKWGRDIDVFVRSTLISLNPNAREGPPRFDHLVVVTDNQAIFDRYQKAFSPGAKYFTWSKNNMGRWTEQEEKHVPPWTEEKISWKILGI
jgi:hypothetical protein